MARLCAERPFHRIQIDCSRRRPRMDSVSVILDSGQCDAMRVAVIKALRFVSERGSKHVVSGSLIAAVMVAEAVAADVAHSGYSMTCLIFHSHQQHQARAVLHLSTSRCKHFLLSLKLTSDVVAI